MNELEKKSYALGSDVAHNFMKMGLTLEGKAFLQGVEDTMGATLKMTPEELHAQFELINKDIEEQLAKKSAKQKEAGILFLEENKKNPEVKVTESGLQYKVEVMGEGPKPTAEDMVNVHYHGTTIDGQVFDSSVLRGETISFGLNQVIKGWTEGLQLMPVGSKFTFYIPSELAYGEQSPSPMIPAGAALVFEVELFGINTK